jgi:uncharacterized integral membrane protein
VARDESVQREGKGHIDGRLVVGGIILVLLIVFIAQNTYETPLNFLFFDFSAPLWLMLAITVVLSLGIGFLLGRRAARRA